MVENHFGLPAEITEILRSKLKYTELSDIQKIVAANAAGKENLICKSKNGSGKSLAITLLLMMRKF